MYKLLGVKKLHGYLIQHGGHGQYFIIAINGIKLLKNYNSLFITHLRCSRWHSGKESACQYRRCKRPGFEPWVGKIPWSRKWQLTPVFLPGKSHGERSPAGSKELDMTEHTHTHTHAYCTLMPYIMLYSNYVPIKKKSDESSPRLRATTCRPRALP